MQGDDRNDQFDELFEPFELSDAPPAPPPPATSGVAPQQPQQTPQPPPPPPASLDATGEMSVSQQHVTTSDQGPSVSCPSCGAQNPSYNHHCERCGSRLSSDPMPIAPAPPSRTSAGGRALGVLAAVVLVVALGALFMNIFGSGDGGDVVGPNDSTTSSTTSTIVTAPIELIPTSVTASSQFSDAFSPENLIDGNPETRWNDNSLRGVGAWLEFTFAQPVQITEMVFQNVEDDESFKRNYKIQGYQIEVNDLNVPISGRLLNSNEPQRVNIASVGTFTLTVSVTTTHLAEPVGQAPPFTELALQGVQFFGYETAATE